MRSQRRKGAALACGEMNLSPEPHNSFDPHNFSLTNRRLGA
jgi:hypothetical protein